MEMTSRRLASTISFLGAPSLGFANRHMAVDVLDLVNGQPRLLLNRLQSLLRIQYRLALFRQQGECFRPD
jgi:hypothetical protein